MADLVKTDGGCLIKEAFAKEICDHMDDAGIHQPAPLPATTIPIADNEADAAIRTGQVGTSLEYARADHNHPIVRQANPGDPVLTFAGSGSLDQQIIQDRWSDEESYSYAFRALVSQDAGTGWGYVNVPTIAGFQQPKITGIGTYRFQSTAVQEDQDEDEEAIGTAGTVGASPRGPFMGAEAHHWSSTRRVYAGYFRRDNPHRTYISFVVEYIRS